MRNSLIKAHKETNVMHDHGKQFLTMCLDVAQRSPKPEGDLIGQIHWSLADLLAGAGQRVEAEKHDALAPSECERRNALLNEQKFDSIVKRTANA